MFGLTVLVFLAGVTEMNEFLGTAHYGSPGFKDPGRFLHLPQIMLLQVLALEHDDASI